MSRPYGQQAKSYRSVEVNAATPAERIVMLYDGLLSRLKRAEREIAGGKMEEKGLSLVKANDIVLGLYEHLDMEKGGEISERLGSLYGFFSAEIMRINRTCDTDALGRLISMIAELHGAWVEASREENAARADVDA